ncbi:protein of unknown function [Burkholderia multivorans]
MSVSHASAAPASARAARTRRANSACCDGSGHAANTSNASSICLHRRASAGRSPGAVAAVPAGAWRVNPGAVRGAGAAYAESGADGGMAFSLSLSSGRSACTAGAHLTRIYTCRRRETDFILFPDIVY